LRRIPKGGCISPGFRSTEDTENSQGIGNPPGHGLQNVIQSPIDIDFSPQSTTASKSQASLLLGDRHILSKLHPAEDTGNPSGIGNPLGNGLQDVMRSSVNIDSSPPSTAMSKSPDALLLSSVSDVAFRHPHDIHQQKYSIGTTQQVTPSSNNIAAT
jgi:hypothetical protein